MSTASEQTCLSVLCTAKMLVSGSFAAGQFIAVSDHTLQAEGPSVVNVHVKEHFTLVLCIPMCMNSNLGHCKGSNRQLLQQLP